MRPVKITFLALAALLPMPSWANTIIVQPGDTLSELAQRHGVAINSIVSLNRLQDSNHLQVGMKLHLPTNEKNKIKFSGRNHTVTNGDTIGQIAKRYKVKEQDLINLNRLGNANYLYLGQQIKLPSSEGDSESRRNPNHHIVLKGETLNAISKQYQISTTKLAQINNLTSPNKLSIGRKLYLKPTSNLTNVNQKNVKSNSKESFRKQFYKPIIRSSRRAIARPPIKSEWRTYGPLKVDWSNWQSMGGSHVAPTINKQGKALYLAINCPAKKLNATGVNGLWREWNSPIDRFEFRLLNDFCKLKST